MKKNTATHVDTHCSVLRQRDLVSKMTQCDQRSSSGDTYKCYLNATKESRENNACMFS